MCLVFVSACTDLVKEVLALRLDGGISVIEPPSSICRLQCLETIRTKKRKTLSEELSTALVGMKYFPES